MRVALSRDQSAHASPPDAIGASYFPQTSADLRWYAAYTCANHEKSVAQQMGLRSIESFLPLYEKVSRWKDRRVKLQLPLFSGYVFVRMALQDRLRVLQIPGVVRLVGFNGIPAPLDNEELELMQRGFSGNAIGVKPCPFLQIGRRVRLKSGPLGGLKGIVLRKKGGYRFVLSIALIQRSVIADVDVADIDPFPFSEA